ncbi:MAG: DUF86 domain-containing protein [Nanoarchaeota archaeon]
MKKDPLVFVKHISDEIEKVERFSKDLTKDQLKKNELKQYAIIRAIEIIGEAVNNIPKEVKRKYSEVSWIDISGMRNKLIHHYFGINLNIVWKTIKEDIPDLKQKILKIKNDLEEKEKLEKKE